MKTNKSIFVFALSLFLVLSCQGGPEKKGMGTFEPNNSFGGNVINFTDSNGLKQGPWIAFYEKAKNDTNKKRTPSEEGEYKDGKKTGSWKYYNSDGSVKNVLKY